MTNGTDTTDGTVVIPPEHFREVLGAFCSGITVITAAGPDGAPLGMTCQSFSSLSLDPPMILIAPALTSTTWPRIREAGTFCVNILADGQHGVSDAMSRRGTDKFADVAWTPSPTGAPRLADVAAWIDCDLAAEHDGGDHTIVVGAVRALGSAPSLEPLLYHRGRYALVRSHPAAASR
ncbi:flavin reductase family protein [Pseudonocardia sp. RS11V-5]|uniref:flavin reductase family protein n=1 Tax=Pseudonocardia terrae TaxID=2905831 RepID=UPI001E4529B9|nr:flavin reductase family protein [Pseudonocardia terrae]MCE3551450.1 flavin reductase family protein [Pseudonocardia terrae]